MQLKKIRMALIVAFALTSCAPAAKIMVPTLLLTTTPTALKTASLAGDSLPCSGPTDQYIGSFSNFKIEKSAEKIGWCKIDATYDYRKHSYSFLYPENYQLGGSPNSLFLFFPKDDKSANPIGFFGLFYNTELPFTLEHVDEELSFIPGPDTGPKKVVDPKEQKIGREIEAIGKNQTLKLITTFEKKTIIRYFFINDQRSVFWFCLETLTSENNMSLRSQQIETFSEMVKTFKFR